MPTKPMPVRLDPELEKLLREGACRTPHKKQELIRMTLRRYLQKVIDEESQQSRASLTNVEPWPKRELDRAYKRIGDAWDVIEEAATRAQGTPHLAGSTPEAWLCAPEIVVQSMLEQLA